MDAAACTVNEVESSPDLLPSFIEILYMRGEESNIFANPAAKWVPPLNIVEYPGLWSHVLSLYTPLPQQASQ